MLLRTGLSPRRSGFGHAGGTVRGPALAISRCARAQASDFNSVAEVMGLT